MTVLQNITWRRSKLKVCPPPRRKIATQLLDRVEYLTKPAPIRQSLRRPAAARRHRPRARDETKIMLFDDRPRRWTSK
jgi:hypothetical protein